MEGEDKWTKRGDGVFTDDETDTPAEVKDDGEVQVRLCSQRVRHNPVVSDALCIRQINIELSQQASDDIDESVLGRLTSRCPQRRLRSSARSVRASFRQSVIDNLEDITICNVF